MKSLVCHSRIKPLERLVRIYRKGRQVCDEHFSGLVFPDGKFRSLKHNFVSTIIIRGRVRHTGAYIIAVYQQVVHFIFVNLHVRDFDEVLEMRIRLYNRLEDLFCDAGYKTFQVWGIYVCAL